MITDTHGTWSLTLSEYGYDVVRNDEVVDSINFDAIRIFVDETTLLQSYLEGDYDGATEATRPQPPRHVQPQGPRHKRVLRDGQVSRGPARWARAAANAFSNPNSKAGKLYLKRTSAAYLLTQNEEFSDVRTYGHPKWRSTDINYYTCSPFCAAMVTQLDHAYRIGSYASLYGFMLFDTARPIPTMPRRKVRCYCCGTDIKP